MVQNASAELRKRGRPPKHDRDAVVASAINAFFFKGYEATTLTDLEDATGADRSTLYNSFGGKAGLYAAATTRYLDLAEDGLFGPLIQGTDDGYGDILEFLANLRSGLTADDAVPGCLIVNDMAAGADPRSTERYRMMLEDGLRRALARAGELDGNRCTARAGLVSTSVLGVNLISKATGDRDEIGRLIDAIMDEVRIWRGT